MISELWSGAHLGYDGVIYLIGNLDLSDPYRILCRLVDRLSERAYFYHHNARMLPTAIYQRAAEAEGISLRLN